ncbi:molybdopterin molybdochelatase [Geoalkalibacter ferrihydriticus]|uniref:Molybdopterin molybdenumtransferase n=2 Tax=Geoalkalibacter ferrihydriticus TaxID=392333 RepID=A0A0C2EG75_9BACT|nr:gephyrin-like molybdotransferase Glp [Geoalkalibacter ferrihydriticus]KIH77618.1 molybdenum cofactor biosynthesis protein MoeA [Geoalkalibacter ferrihydriticus DSM 17813]SDL70400.1 molybdopterin molybdochelatase [Geoalkalibacter ferrihydriticus]
MLRFEEARRLILTHTSPLDTERISLFTAGGRVLAEEIRAPWDLPPWDNSAMDGYAVRLADCAPGRRLPVRGYLPAGAVPGAALAPGAAAKIMTGAPLPAEADTIVPFEQADEQDGQVSFSSTPQAGAHIRRRAEDLRSGDLVIPAGTPLRPAEIGMLATFGKILIPVFRRARIAVLSTGDELVEPGDQLGEGRIINSNALAIAAALSELGAEPVLLGIARDNRESHLQLLGEGLKADALITSAGISTGDRDLVREVLLELGATEIFYKINIKPGRPTAFLRFGAKPVFCLPGNPVATLITFEELVKPAVLRMMGHHRAIQPFIKGTLREDVRKKPGRGQFLRVALEIRDGRILVSTSGDQNTGILRTLVRAGGLVYLAPEATHLPAGSEVDVHLLGTPREALDEQA